MWHFSRAWINQIYFVICLDVVVFLLLQEQDLSRLFSWPSAKNFLANNEHHVVGNRIFCQTIRLNLHQYSKIDWCRKLHSKSNVHSLAQKKTFESTWISQIWFPFPSKKFTTLQLLGALLAQEQQQLVWHGYSYFYGYIWQTKNLRPTIHISMQSTWTLIKYNFCSFRCASLRLNSVFDKCGVHFSVPHIEQQQQQEKNFSMPHHPLLYRANNRRKIRLR